MTSAEPTRARFLAAYRMELERRYPDHAESLAKAAKGCIEGQRPLWSPGLSYYAQRAWTAIGGEGRVGLGKLRGLAE